MLCLLLSLNSCDYFKPKESKKAIARVGNKTLYLEDVLFPESKFQSEEDSLLYLQNKVDQWALEELTFQKATFNLPQEQQNEYDQMANRYKVELYSKAYKDALIERRIKASFSEEDIIEYYSTHKQNFRLNEVLLQLRYLHLNPNLKDLDKIKTSFQSFTIEDQVFLETRKLEYRNYQSNDSVWIRASDVLKDIPLIGNKISKEEFINQKKFLELSDSTSLFLVKINDVLLPNDVAPLTYIKPTIEQILTNRLKFEVQKEIEKELIKDGIKNNEFEIYN
jgi:hypothetical protein